MNAPELDAETTGILSRSETLLRAAGRVSVTPAFEPVSDALAALFEQAAEDNEICAAATSPEHMCRYCREDEWPAVLDLAEAILATY